MIRERWLSSDVAERTCAALEKCVVRPWRRITASSGPGCRELWIHIGAHKTATTLVQSILKRRRHVLHCQSVHFEPWGYQLGKTLMKASPVVRTTRAGLRDELERRLRPRPEPVAILSAESLCGRPYDGYRNVAAVARDLREITCSFDVRIVLVERRQDDLIASIYGQLIKKGHRETFAEFLTDGLLESFDWDRLARAYQEQFGDDRVRRLSYERLIAVPSRAVETLFHGCGQSFVCRVRDAGRVNPGLSPKGLELARRCNDLLEPAERKHFRRFLETHHCNRPGDGNGALDECVKQSIREYYRLDDDDRLSADTIAQGRSASLSRSNPVESVPAGFDLRVGKIVNSTGVS